MLRTAIEGTPGSAGILPVSCRPELFYFPRKTRQAGSLDSYAPPFAFVSGL